MNQTSPTAFQFAYMALAIDITDGGTKRIVSYCQIRASNAVFAIRFTVKAL